MRKRLAAFALAAGIVLGAHAQAEPSTDSRVREWISPDRNTKIISAISSYENGLTEFELRLFRAGREPVVIDTYSRSVDVSWSPDSKYVAVTDFIGSDVADCYIVETEKPENKVSIQNLIPKVAEDLGDSHHYVSCVTWLSEKHVGIKLSGHTDYPPYHEFLYLFVYDVEGKRLRRL